MEPIDLCKTVLVDLYVISSGLGTVSQTGSICILSYVDKEVLFLGYLQYKQSVYTLYCSVWYRDDIC